MQEYIDNFFTILVEFFNMNELKINREKTGLIIASHLKDDRKCRNIKITNLKKEDDILASDHMKILGYHTNKRFRHDNLISCLFSNSTNIIFKASKLKRYITENAMKCLMETQVLS